MRENPPPTPPRKPAADPAPKDPKAARLAEALRANLARRKAQARSRAAETTPPRNGG
jgi:hypothetical protein